MSIKRIVIIAGFLVPIIIQAQKKVVKSKISLTENVFYIKNVASGKYLDLPGAATKAQKNNGANVQLWDLDDGADRKVKFIPAGNGYYHIQFQHASVNLDVHGCFKGKPFCGTYKTDKGANVQIWNAGKSEPQQWRLEQVNPGQFRIVNRYSGKVLDADAHKINQNGCNVQQWDKNNGTNQLWEIIDVQTATRYQE